MYLPLFVGVCVCLCFVMVVVFPNHAHLLYDLCLYVAIFLGKSFSCIVCKDDCICKNFTCPDDKIAYCKKEKNPEGNRICHCKSCVSDSGYDDSDDDDDE